MMLILSNIDALSLFVTLKLTSFLLMYLIRIEDPQKGSPVGRLLSNINAGKENILFLTYVCEVCC